MDQTKEKVDSVKSTIAVEYSTNNYGPATLFNTYNTCKFNVNLNKKWN